MKKVILLLIVFSISICVLGCNNKNEYTNKIIHSGTQITKSNKNNSETQKNITTEISAEKTTINSSTKFDTTNKTSKKINFDFLKKYKSPNLLTDNCTDYIFKLEGQIYRLPVPVSVLLDDGWTITSQPESIPANSEFVFGLDMKKDNIELSFTIKNFANKPVDVENTMIIGMFIDNRFLKKIDFELSGRINFDMTLADFLEKPYAFQFVSGNSDFGDIEYSYFASSSYIYLDFKDDKLFKVDFSNKCF